MFNSSSYLLAAADGGGTGCRAAIADAAGVRFGVGHGGPANFTTNADQAIRSVHEALNAAASDAGLEKDWQSRCIAHLGLAGVMSPQDARDVARAMTIAHVEVSDDRVTSVTGALGDREGVLAAIGTGTIIAGRKSGELRFFGGWGHQLSDQASGGWLGRTALRLMMLAHDGLEAHSPLTRDLFARFQEDPKNVIAFAAKAAPGDFAGLARTVIEAARAGDTHGCALMGKGAAYLDKCIRTFGLQDEAAICLAGGIGPHYADFIDAAFRDRIRPVEGSALDGALRLAAEAYENKKGSL